MRVDSLGVRHVRGSTLPASIRGGIVTGAAVLVSRGLVRLEVTVLAMPVGIGQ